MALNTTLTDIHSDIIQTHILTKLDGPSLSTTATVSSYLQSLCSDHHLWLPISKSTWPSITDPRVDDVISTFPSGHRSFFQDSFPSLITNFNQPHKWSTDSSSSHDLDRPSQLISAVDIHYQNDIIYSRVEFTNTTNDFLSSDCRIELKNDPTSKNAQGISRSIDLIVDEISGANKSTLLHLKDSLKLNWILIHPARKRAGNLSSIKPIISRQDWATNETLLRYVIVLPGDDVNEMVQCKIQVVLGVGERGIGLYVKEVVLKLQGLDCNFLSGRDFLVITRRAIMEENNVTRKVIDDEEERWKNCKLFKEMKQNKEERLRKQNERRELAINCSYVGLFLSFLLSIYYIILLL
ncbi:F-box protein At2g27310-like [Rutidosis leptorrhynchoides]|uniref:F-box protein At2g27310-like n=1 Tax=Rutidosis leptorrhynchoides TaxID=125765 RepID=UPI003A998424